MSPCGLAEIDHVRRRQHTDGRATQAADQRAGGRIARDRADSRAGACAQEAARQTTISGIGAAAGQRNPRNAEDNKFSKCLHCSTPGPRAKMRMKRVTSPNVSCCTNLAKPWSPGLITRRGEKREYARCNCAPAMCAIAGQRRSWPPRRVVRLEARLHV